MDWESNFNNQIINTTPSEKPKIIKRLITDLYSNYFKKVYLFKANDIDDKFYSLKDIECSRLKYFKSIKEILNQNNNAIKEWFWH